MSFLSDLHPSMFSVSPQGWPSVAFVFTFAGIKQAWSYRTEGVSLSVLS